MFARWLCGLALAIGCFGTTTHAADIRETDDKLCAFRLYGEILSGDSLKFSLMIQRNESTIEINKDVNRIRDWEDRLTTVCLNSPGGSFDEGLSVAELIYNNGLSTLVENGSECFSSCAVIFMAGIMPSEEAPYRKLSVDGALGFHAPFLQMPENQYSKGDVEEYSQGLRKAISGLVKLSSKKTLMAGGDLIKKSLLQRILENGPKELAFVQTIFDAARWNIVVYDADEKYSIPYNKVIGVENMCKNYLYANLDEPVPDQVNWAVKIDKYIGKDRKQQSRILVVNAHTQDTVCELYATGGARKTSYNPDGVAFRGCASDYWSGKSFLGTATNTGDVHRGSSGITFRSISRSPPKRR